MMELTTSGYYAWRDRAPSKRAVEDAALTEKIRIIHADNDGIYGSPKVREALQAQQERHSRKRIARLMRQANLRGVPCKRRCRTTDSAHTLPVADNLLNRDFTATEPGQKWVSDITYIWTTEGWLYLAVVIDLFSRRVIGWSMSPKIDEQLVDAAITMAVTHGRISKGLIFHSDRGSQYAANDIVKKLADLGIRQSMSRKGNCWDNAVAESFFGTLKRERVYRTRYARRSDARTSIFEYIEAFYNNKRLHSSIGYTTPAECERRFKPVNTCPL